ncbi:MAG: FkbM family methyltransferase [Elusimicrobiaceae bacterium]|nr:FkbM family methyltransferase [Elusimicrobiaceae bacterium]
MSYEIGFLKLRFTVEEGSKKEYFLKKIVQTEDNIKRSCAKLLKKKIPYIKHSVSINNQQFYFCDITFSRSYTGIVKEIENDCYGFSKINFKENDIVIDIGANIGLVSIYLAKKYPFLKIYSFEPFKENYACLIKNIEINNIPKGTITPFNLAVTKDNRNVVMKTNDILDSGSFTVNFEKSKLESNHKDIVKSTTLNKIIETVLAENKQDHVKLLKMDCELSEYEILNNTKTENLKKISYLGAEFHAKKNFGNPDDLEAYVKKYIPNITITKCSLD